MANTDVRISDLSELTLLDSGDLFVVVETGASSNTTKKMTFSSLQSSFPSRHLFTVQAEENTVLSTSTNDGFQWSFGDSVTTASSGHGIPIVFASKLVGFGFQGERGTAGNVSVEVYKGATPTLLSGTLSSSNEVFTSGLSSPIDFEAGTTLNFKTNQSAGSLSKAIAVAYLVATGTPGTPLFNF